MEKEFSFSHLLRALTLLAVIAAVAPLTLSAGLDDRLAQTQQGEAGASVPVHQYDVLNIRLNLRFDWEREQAIGTATITMKPQVNNLRVVELDATNMTFNSVKLASGAVLKFETDAAKEKLRLTLDREYQPADVLTLTIDYHTNGVSPERALGGTYRRGLVFIKPTDDDPARPRQIWTQGQPAYNHYWFPCYDRSDDFATSEITATVDKPLIVISNGSLVETRDNADGTRTFAWKIDVPHANYLTSIIVGEYATIETSYDGIPIRTNVDAKEIELAKVTAANTGKMIELFSRLVGIKYPYAKYDQTFVRDFGLGMEQITASTLSDQLLQDARAALDHPSEGLLAHEAAHQWFGNYVTTRDWNHIWLSEGFAVYFQGLWHENHLGLDDFYYRDVKPNQDRYLAAWAEGNRRPLVPKEYSNADALFDLYTYQRSGAVLHMLRNVLGEENWRRGIRHFLTKHAHQPVDTEQFQKAIEETSGQSLGWFFDQWVYRMGHPVFNVSQVYDPATRTLALTIRQEQQLDPNSRQPQQRFFRMPAEIKIATASRQRIERVQIEPQEVQVFRFKVDSAPQFSSFDPHGILIKEMHFTKSTSELLYQLANDSDLPGRLWALNQLRPRLLDKATTAKEKQEIADALALALTRDKFWGLRLQAAMALESMPGKESQTALRLALKDKNAAVRAQAITSLSAANDATLAGTYEEMLVDPSYEVVKAAALALGKTKSAHAYGALEKLLTVASWRDTIRTAALRGLAMLGDPRSRELALQYSQKSYPISVRAGGIALLGAVGRGDPNAYPLITAAFLQAFMIENRELGFAASEALVNVCDARGLEFLSAIAKKVEDPQGQAFVSDLSQRLQKCVTEEARKAPGGSQD